MVSSSLIEVSMEVRGSASSEEKLMVSLPRVMHTSPGVSGISASSGSSEVVVVDCWEMMVTR